MLDAVGGVAIGLAVGWLVEQVRRRIDDPPVEVTISLLTGYAAYIPAEELGRVGRARRRHDGHLPRLARRRSIASATTRLQAFAVWEILVFLLNATLFVLVGLQLPIDRRAAVESADRRRARSATPRSSAASS